MAFLAKRPIIRLRSAAVRNALALGLLTALLAVWTVPVAADPPPWAPAHGWRAKQMYKQKRYANDAAPYGLDLGLCNRVVLGGMLGGATGAVLGSTVDKNDGRSAAIVGGAITVTKDSKLGMIDGRGVFLGLSGRGRVVGSRLGWVDGAGSVGLRADP